MRAVPLGPASDRTSPIRRPPGAGGRADGKAEDLGGISTAEAERGQLVDGLLGLLLSPRPARSASLRALLRGPPRRSANLGERHGLKGPPGRGPAEGKCRCLPDAQACLVQAAAVGLTSLQSFDADVPGVVLRVSFVDGDIGLLRGQRAGTIRPARAGDCASFRHDRWTSLRKLGARRRPLLRPPTCGPDRRLEGNGCRARG